jgi:hypothetical protein
MKVASFLYLLLFLVHISACSEAVEENNVKSDPKSIESAPIASERSFENTSGPSIETSSPNPGDVVLFDGKNYIKKSGWKTPSKKDAYIDEDYDQGEFQRVTESGKTIRTSTIQYFYKAPWLHSQVFYYNGRDLDYLKGKLESNNFLEMRANGKVFLYSVFGIKVVASPLDNGSHEEPFGYRIQDRDGDGIFETLLSADIDIVVPNWVLK